jgi:effector-binding domain-containing protein
MTPPPVEMLRLTARPAAVVRGHVALADLPAFLGGTLPEVMEVLGRQHVSPAGPPFGRYVPSGGGFDAEVGFPVDAAVTPAGRVDRAVLPGGQVAAALHVGNYGEVAQTYERLAVWIDDHGCAPSGQPWETYLDEPDVAEPRTLVHMPCRPKQAAR